MGTRYTTESVSGYNATPPADDGTVSEANKLKWSTIKTKLPDPIKTALENIDSKLTTHFNNGPTALTTNTTLDSTYYNKVIQVSGSGVTLTLTDANTLGAGWFCDIISTDASNNVTLARATASNTINETSSDVTILTLQALKVVVNAAATGFLVNTGARHSKAYKTAEATTMSGQLTMSGKPIIHAEGAAVASAATCDIWTPADGDTVHVTGTTTITSFGTAPQAGAYKRVIFDGALTLTHGANLNIPGSTNITTATNDNCLVYADTTTQLDILNYVKASGVPIVAPTAAQGASKVLIGSPVTISTTSFVFTTGIDSTYDEYEIVIQDLTQTNDNNALMLRVSEDSGSTYKSGASDYEWVLNSILAGTGLATGTDAADAQIYCNYNSANHQLGNSTAGSATFTIRFFKPSDTTMNKHFDIRGRFVAGTSGALVHVDGSGMYKGTTNAINALQFLNGGGNMSGTAYLYGIKKS